MPLSASQPPHNHPSAALQPLEQPLGEDNARPRASLSALGNSRESTSRTYLSVFIYLFIHQGGEEVGSQPF